MPARSVLLNVSMTARGLGKASLAEEVKEINVEEENDAGKEGKRERVDSATADFAPCINKSFAFATAYTALPTPMGGVVLTTEVQGCATCRQPTKADGSRLSHCKACTSVFYCSRDCQRIHWKAHKRHCRNSSNSSNSGPPSPAFTPPPTTTNSANHSVSASPTYVYNTAEVFQLIPPPSLHEDRLGSEV